MLATVLKIACAVSLTALVIVSLTVTVMTYAYPW
jgi:hypothetical protein